MPMDNITFREGYVIRDQNAAHFLTFTVCGWIDLFTRKTYKDILIDSFKYCQQKKGLRLHAFVVMSNHVHLIASAKLGYKLSDIIRDFKKYTHHSMMKIIQSEAESRRLWMLHQFAYYATKQSGNENYQIWVHNSHPEALYSSEMTMAKLWYIHDNPVRAGWVAEQAHYLYSSAANYAGLQGLLKIDLL
jgi:putative transposase